jgi:hypothetical protein
LFIRRGQPDVKATIANILRQRQEAAAEEPPIKRTRVEPSDIESSNVESEAKMEPIPLTSSAAVSSASALSAGTAASTTSVVSDMDDGDSANGGIKIDLSKGVTRNNRDNTTVTVFDFDSELKNVRISRSNTRIRPSRTFHPPNQLSPFIIPRTNYSLFFCFPRL